MAIDVHDGGRDVTIQVEVDPNGFIFLKAYEGDNRTNDMPKMTPFEACLLARDLQRAADKMNRF